VLLCAMPVREEELRAEALASVVHVLNRTPKAGLYVKPREALPGRRPNVTGFLVWGSRAWALNLKMQQRKLDARTDVGLFVGYTVGGKSYGILEDETNQVFERRDVRMEENPAEVETSADGSSAGPRLTADYDGDNDDATDRAMEMLDAEGGREDEYAPDDTSDSDDEVVSPPLSEDSEQYLLTTDYNSQQHRSTGIAFFLNSLFRDESRVLSERNLPPGTPLKDKGTLNNGPPLARKREFMAKLRQQITAVEEALQKTHKRYKRNFDSNVDTRDKRVRVGDYVHTTNHQQENKLQSRTGGPFVVLDADDSTYVVDVNGRQRRVNSDHVTPAPRPSTPDESPHPLRDGLDTPESTPPVPEEYVIDRLLKLRQSNGIYRAKVRWFDYALKDDSWEPLKNVPRNWVIRLLRQKKKKSAGYSWSILTPPSRGTRRSRRLNQAETALVVTPQRPDPKWSSTILGVFSNSHGEIRITLNWIKIDQYNSVQETLPTCWVRLTLPERTRNILNDPLLAFWRFAELSEWHGPNTYVWPCPPPLQGNDAPPAPVTQGVGLEPNGLLLPFVHDRTPTFEDLMYQSTEATLIAPRWESTSWYILAKATCASHDVLPHASKDHNDTTTWARVAFHFNRKTNSATQAKPSLSN